MSPVARMRTGRPPKWHRKTPDMTIRSSAGHFPECPRKVTHRHFGWCMYLFLSWLYKWLDCQFRCKRITFTPMLIAGEITSISTIAHFLAKSLPKAFSGSQTQHPKAFLGPQHTEWCLLEAVSGRRQLLIPAGLWALRANAREPADTGATWCRDVMVFGHWCEWHLVVYP